MYRGMGAGRALWEKGIIPWCREHGLQHLGACVMASNTGAIGFYEKPGFKVCGYHTRMAD